MRAGLRWLLVCLLCCAVGLCWSAVAFGEGSAGGSSLFEGSLVVPGSPTEGEQLLAQEQARLTNPETVAVREESRTKFENLDTEQAMKLAGEVFPAVIDEPGGGPPVLPAGDSITGYLSDNAASLDLGEGRHGVLESLAPIAVETGPGQRVPVDLGLRDVGGAFEPASPVVGVSIPKRLRGGVAFAGVGVSLTPVDGSGSALAGSEGALDGASVFYANTQTDADTVVRPTTGGFELDTMLRSIESPGQLSFRVGLPAGASLVAAKDGSGDMEVVAEGAALATVVAPSARDAAGTAVPVSMAASGNVLTLTVDHRAGQYPIAVDPFVKDDEQVTGAGKPTNWKFCVNFSTVCAHEEGPFKSTGWGGAALVDQARSKYVANETSAFVYQTQGESRIFDFNPTVSGENAGANMESVIQLVGLKEKEGKQEETIEGTDVLSVSTNYGSTSPSICANEGCTSAGGTPHNIARFQQTATGSGEHFSDTMSKANVEITQANNPEQPTFNYSSEKIAGRENVLHEKGGWLSLYNGAFEVHDKDPGVGISYFHVDIAGGWSLTHEYFEEGKCSGIQCFPEVNEPITYSSTMPDGEDTVEAVAKDLTGGGGYSLVGQAKVKVDGTPPHGIVLSGLSGSGVINESQYHLQAQATDGAAKTPSSGVKSIALYLDGFEVAGKSGSCPAGPCTSVGEWTINGETFGAGKHKLAVQAIDNVGNKETKEYTVTVRHAGSLGVGPGSVDPITGAFHLSASDVSIGGGEGSVGVSRSYNSRQLTAGEGGPLGPQWSLNVSGTRALEREPSGSVLLIAPDGGLTTFEGDGKGGFISPKGDENLVLSAEKEGETIKAYLLKDAAAGTTVRYTQPGGAGPWVIASSEGSLSQKTGGKETFEWERIEGLTRPKEAYAPIPAGVSSCAPKPEHGCRALKFVYATKTTATGEAPSQWGEYNGRLKSVVFIASNPVETTVAEYLYDGQGRLRAEWDPRISPALKVTYGYDTEGHVVAVNPPGLQPSLLHYGTTASDPSAGRLLSVMRPGASTPTELKEADERPAPSNTGLPTLSSTSPVIGTTLSVASNGSWSNSPLAYAYQWKDCDVKGEKCAAIAGAVNQSYTPQVRDAGYTLVASVSAINSDGAGIASTAHSATLALPASKYTLKFGAAGEGAGQLKNPTGAAIDAGANVWVVDHNNNRIDKFTASGTFVETLGWGVANGEGKLQTCTSSCRAGIAGPFNGQFSLPDGNAIGEGNLIYVADAGNNRIEELNTSNEFVRAFGVKGAEPGQLQNPVAVALTPTGNVWVADRGNNRIDEFSGTGEYLGSFGSTGTEAGKLKEPSGIAFSGEYAYVVDSGNSRVEQFTLSGAYVAQFGTAGSGNGQFSKPAEIATEPVSGDLYVADTNNNRIEEFNPAGTFLASVGSAGEGEGHFNGVEGIALSAAGSLYGADLNNNRVQEFEPTYSTNNPAPEPPVPGTTAVSTIDYNIPLWGEGAPDTTAKTEAEKKAELEKWGQTDDPTEATAIFPPDEPMGWPAKDYTRATITYLDELGRTVNSASPSGGIATSEYNETNEVIRSLSAGNRAAALKEGSKSAEVSQLLDTESKYNGETKAEKEQEEKEEKETGRPAEPGTRLLETRGPQHTVKILGAGEKPARNHVRYYYDEGAPTGETFDLVTKTTDGAEYEGKESEVRTTTTSYSGQENLGWLLRKPTSVTTDPEGLHLIHTTIYDPATGKVIETKQPAAEAPMSYAAAFGSTGTGNGQFKEPTGIAIAPNGNVYVIDANNKRVQEFSPSGAYLTQFGAEGTGNGQFKGPTGIAVAANGNVYVVDSGNARVQEFTASGEYLAKFGTAGTGNGQFKEATGIAVAPNGNVYVADGGNARVQEFSATGTYITQWGSEGTGNGQFKFPQGVAVAPNGNVYVLERTGSRVQEFSASGGYLAKFGSAGTGNGQFNLPYGIAVGPNGNVYVADTKNDRLQEFSASGEYMARFGTLGSSSGQFFLAFGVALAPNGKIYVTDGLNNRVQELVAATEIPSLYSMFGSEGMGNGQFKGPQATAVAPNGNVYAADTGNNRIEELSSTGTYVTKWGSEGTGNGQFKGPQGIAVAPNGNVYVVDTGNNRVQEFTASGTYVTKWGSEGTGNGQFKGPQGIAVAPSGSVYVVDGGNNRVQEFTASGTYVTKWGSEGTGNGQFKTPQGIALAPNGNAYVIDTGNNRVQEFFSAGEYLTKWGSAGKGSGLFTKPAGVAVTKSGNVYVTEAEYSTMQEFTANGEYIATTGATGSGAGQFKGPKGLAAAPNGNLYVADTGNNRVQRFQAANARDTQTIYYSAAANSTYPSCGGHAEWANLPCQAQPAAQPLGSVPSLPVVTSTYNHWDEPEVITEKLGSTTRTKTMTYDAAGRPMSNEETSSVGSPLPKVTNEYSAETGAMVKQSTTVGESTKTLQSAYNTLGQLTSYTDADGSISNYTYDIDGRPEELSYEINKETYSQIYSYDPTTGAPTKLFDSTAKTFTASYDVEGRMTSESYPNAMNANYTYNAASEATGIEYEKSSHCAGTCPEAWFKETSLASIHGEVLTRTNTLAAESYGYDKAGRLTSVQETPASKGCTTRLYAYDEDSNRLSLLTREPGSEGKCASEGGTSEPHTYDEADRLADSAVSYEPLGNTTSVPAADAGGSALTSSYYVDNQTASQKQSEETISYGYDPAGRTRETISTGPTKSTVVNHYSGPGEALSWSSEGAEKWTRNIPGIDGTLTATQKNSEAPALQLHDLQGNIVAEAAAAETETKLLKSYNSTEYGVPTTSSPPKYSWLGALGQATELATGATTSGGSGYVPQLGRALQTQGVIPPGAFPNGAYTAAPYTTTLEPWVNQSIGNWGAGGTGREATRQAEAKKQQEEAEARYRASHYVPEATPEPGEGGAEEPEEEGEAEAGEAGESPVARTASVIACGGAPGYPHISTHAKRKGLERVNVVFEVQCTAVMSVLRIRIALYWNHKLVADSGYVIKYGASWIKAIVNVSCRSGLYQTWDNAAGKPPGGEAQIVDNSSNWGTPIGITC